MRKFFSEYKKPAISAVVFFVTLATLSYSYAAFTALTDVITGQTLSKDAWNTMIADLNDLNGRSVPQGAVMAFFWSSCPINWSPADGTTNGVKKTDGTSGTLDLRGEFIRGLDSVWVGARNVDAGRALGSSQSDILQGHEHTLAGLKNTAFWAGSTHWNNAPWYSDTWSSQLIGGPISDGTNWTPRTGAETRPRNVALLYCVKN